MTTNKTKTTTAALEKASKTTKKVTKKTTKKAGQGRKAKKTLTISEQIEAFLKSGGEIQQIPSGVSGQPSLACRRSMTISEKAPERTSAKTA